MKRIFRVYRVFILLVSINIFLVGPSWSQTENNTLALGEVLRHAYLYNPTLLAAREELKAAHESLPQAMAGWKPTILSSASIANTEIDGNDATTGDGSTAKSVGVSLDQPLYRGGKTMAQTSAARHAIESRRSLLYAREQDILRETATAYMNVLRDQALLDLSQATRDVIARERKATQDRFDVGELTKTDVSQADARLARADSDVITATGQLNASKARFEEIIGIPAAGLAKPEDLNLPVPPDLEQATLQAEQASPLVVASIHAHKASENDIDDVFSALLPEIGLFSSWDKAYDPSPGLVDDQTTTAIGIAATIPLYEAGAVRSRVREAKHTANQRYIEISEARRQVRQAVVSDWSVLQAAQSEIHSRQAQVEAATIAQEGVSQETEFGSRTVLDVLDANQELLDAQVALVSAERNEIVAKFSLLSTLGLLSPQTLGFANDAINYSDHLADIQTKIFDMDVDRVQEVD